MIAVVPFHPRYPADLLPITILRDRPVAAAAAPGRITLTKSGAEPVGWPAGARAQNPRLLDQVRAAVRTRHYRRRTEKAYVGWIRRCILFHGKRHPAEMGEAEVTRFLTHLAVAAKVSASTQKQALSAVLFLYRDVLRTELDWLDGVVRAKRPQRVPVVLTREEVRAILDRLHRVERLMASLRYGAGLRLLECCRLRAKDVDLARRELVVRDGKGARDRVAPVPMRLVDPLAEHLDRVRRQHEEDRRQGAGSVELPFAIERKYPRSAWEWGWQWVFPATRSYLDPASGRRRRHHLHESVLQRAVREAVIGARISKRASCRTLREAYA